MSADCGRLDVHNARTSQSSASNGCQNCQLRPQQARSPQAAESNGRPVSSMRATTGPPFPSSSTAISWDHPGGTVHGHVGHSLFETKVNVEGQIRRYALASPGFDPCLKLVQLRQVVEVINSRALAAAASASKIGIKPSVPAVCFGAALSAPVEGICLYRRGDRGQHSAEGMFGSRDWKRLARLCRVSECGDRQNRSPRQCAASSSPHFRSTTSPC